MRPHSLLQIAAILAISGALVGFTASFTISRRYVAHATMTAASGQDILDASNRALSKESLIPIVLQSINYKPRLDFTPMDELIQQIRDSCVMTRATNSDTVTLEFTDDDRYAAMEMGRALLARMGDKVAGAKAEPLRLTETGPTRAMFTGAGFAGGLSLTALVWLLFRRQMAPR
jgi:hypothetical protein